MGCGSCSSGGCSPAGCGNKGACASGGCNRLNVFDWLSDVDLPWGQPAFDIVEVHFKGTRKDFYRNSEGLDLFPGDWVVVEGQSGHDVGKVSLKGELVKLQMKRKKVAEDHPGIRKIYRKATEQDVEKLLELRAKEPEIIAKARNIIKSTRLDMKLGDVEYQGDKSKIIFYYTADERVDFRELIRLLADEFKARIEMKQIGARQEAGRIGGIGVCGLELCCSSWMSDFRTVSTSAARYQNLSLNPAKLAGQCGRLKCCLNYELETYMDALKDFPNDAKLIQTANVSYELVKTDIFKKQMWYQLQTPRGSNSTAADQQLFALSPEKVKELREMNKKGIKPDSIDEHMLRAELDLVEEDLDFESVAEGGLDRFDRNNKRKKKHKPKNRARTQDAASSAVQTANGENRRPDNRRQDNNRNPKPEADKTGNEQAASPRQAQNENAATPLGGQQARNRNNRHRNNRNRPRPDQPKTGGDQ